MPAVDMKFDDGKPRIDLLIIDFPRALLAVGEIAGYGAKKYAASSWLTVKDAMKRYTAALGRHILRRGMGEKYDQESKLRHAAHIAWNALAVLELELREDEHDNVAQTK